MRKLVIAFGLVLMASGAQAIPITVPSGLNVGDQYRLAFVTSTFLNPYSSDIETYNSFVSARANTVAELVALGTTWKAIGSTATVDARDNTNTNPSSDGVGVPIYLLNDLRLADDNADLWGSGLDTRFRVTESGGVWLSDGVWTGTSATGEGSSVLGSSTPRIGWAQAINSAQWVSYTDLGTNWSHPVYALSGVLTVVPEPSTGLLVSTGLLGLAARRRSLRS